MTALTKDITEPKVRSAPKIDANLVTVNADGFKFRHIFVRLPRGFVADDLKEPSVWSSVQHSRMALRKHDHLYLVAYDESWSADCIVCDANADQAVLSKPRMINFPERYDRLFEDENYRVAWMGAGYVVERKTDGHRMTQQVATVAMAERDLRNLYHVRA